MRTKKLRRKKLCSNVHTIQNDKNLIGQVVTDYNNFSVWPTDHEIVHSQFVPEDHNVNQILYMKVLRSMRNAIHRKRPNHWPDHKIFNEMCKYTVVYMYSFSTFFTSLSCINSEFLSILHTQELFKSTVLSLFKTFNAMNIMAQESHHFING